MKKIIIIILLIIALAESIVIVNLANKEPKVINTKELKEVEKVQKIYINSNNIEITEEEYNNLLKFYSKEFINQIDDKLYETLRPIREGNLNYTVNDKGIPILK